MLLLDSILNSVLYVLALYLLLNCFYLLFFALAGHIKPNPLIQKVGDVKYRRFCVLIPAYKEDGVISETGKVALNHKYVGSFDVYVIADSLQSDTVNLLRNQGIGVVEVSFERSTKGKALLYALNALPENLYDVAVVLDADNIMGKNVLNDINLAFEAGYKVVQTHRTAKNKETAFAYLDACNEEINNHIYRKGHYAVGLSSALIGSGMAFDYDYLKRLLHNIGETVGEDKELDFRIARDKEKICYLDSTYVFDEKIENAKVFTQQRTRWIAAQFEFLKKYAGEGIVQLLKFGNMEFFNKVMQAFLVPRTLLIGVLGVLFLMSLLIPAGPPAWFWFCLLTLLSLILLISLPARLYNRQLSIAMLRLPYAIFCMCLALFRINRIKASFLPTPHKANTVSPSLDN